MNRRLVRWIASSLGVATLAALLWFFGPFAAVLAGAAVRAIIIVVLLLVWLGVNLWLDRRLKTREAALQAGVTAAAADPAEGEKREEVAALAEKLRRALALLARARGRRGYLYEQPWYVIIGPPGAGKTTALLNSGLKFPLAAELGQGAVAGVGGTRRCDWWFTDNAVLIDTAGRYTTQDSSAAVDAAGWLGFLDLLRRTRPRQPLNGVLVAIALADIAGAPEATRRAHAQAIRARIKEITARLGVEVPVYALFTKADLVAGFTEFFDDLDAEGRRQVWGATFASGRDRTGGVVARFDDEFRALVARIDARMLDRLAAERNADRRAAIAGFPAQFGSLEAPLADFLGQAFGGSSLDPSPWLRGVYFTSGTQEGTPIDRLTGALSRAFGIDQRRAPSLRPQSGRAYFLGRLLTDVIFGEAMLGSPDRKRAQRRGLLAGIGYGAVGLGFAGALAALLISHGNNEAGIARARASIAAEQHVAERTKLDPVASADLTPVLPLLNSARGLDHLVPVAGYHGFGLDQAPPIRAATNTVYRHTLDYALLPRLILQLEAEMRGGIDRPAYLYQATRVYLMLGGQGPLDRSLVEAWMQLDWQRLYPGPGKAEARAEMMGELSSLLARPLPPVPLDGQLIATARATFSRVPLAARVYSRMRDSAAASHLSPWTPAAALGAAGQPLFVNTTGKTLIEGIAGFYTRRGFYTVLLPALSHASEDVAKESWVLGRRNAVAADSPQLRSLEGDVIKRYEKDYAARWQAMIDRINLAPLGGAQQTAQALYVLASPQSPMKSLLTSMASELTLTKKPKSLQAPGKGSGKAGAAAANAGANAKVNAAAASLKGLMPAAPNGAAPAPPGSAVDRRFAALRAYVDGGGANAPIGMTMQLIDTVQKQVATLAASAPGAQAAAPSQGGQATTLLAGEAKRDPEPVARWLSSIVATADRLRGGSAAQAAAAAFNAPGGAADLCRQAVVGHYPFAPGSAQGIPLADFARLFAPGGTLDGFFNTNVRPYVNMAGRHWRVQAVNGVAPPVSQGSVDAFQRAQRVQQMFFAGGNSPQVHFTVTPESLSADAAQVSLQLGKVTIDYAHGPTVPTSVAWPGPNGMQSARLIITPAAGGTPVTLSASGPWAVFRLFHDGRLAEAGSSARYMLSFEGDGMSASFAIEAGSVFNPFAPGVLAGFHCPRVGG